MTVVVGAGVCEAQLLVAMLVGLMTLVMVTREAEGVTVTVVAGDMEGVTVTVVAGDMEGVTVTVAEAGHVEPLARVVVTVIVDGAPTLPGAVMVAVT